MKTKYLIVVILLAFIGLGATTIHFFTDYPNGIPFDSDFFVYQRNQTYGNASGTQMKSYFWANPSFTGNGSISGSFVANGGFFGNGAGISNLATGIFLAKTNDIGSGETFVGVTTFSGPGNGIAMGTGSFLFGNLTNSPAAWSSDGSLTNLNLVGAVFTPPNTLTIQSTNSSTTVTNSFTIQTNAMGYGIVTNALQALNVTAPNIATFDSAKQLTNGAVSARFNFSANVLDLASGVVTPGTYRSVTVDTYGRTTAGTDPTTFSGYAISDTSANFLSALSDDQFIQYDTNSIPSSGVFTFRHSYFTNMQHDITMPAFTIVDATKYESFVLIVTNSDSATHAWTVPAGCRVAIANGGGNKIYCTNATMTSIYVEHYGVLYTNAWKNDY